MIASVKASTLFEEIVEGKSLQDAMEQLAGRAFDAVFLGASLQLEISNDFFEKAAKLDTTGDCAFILIYREALEETSVLKEVRAHCVVSNAASKQTFTETVIRAILMANKNSPWPGVKLDQDGSVLINEQGVWRKLSMTDLDHEIARVASPESPETQSENLVSAEVLQSLARACGEKVVAVNAEELKRLLQKVLEKNSAPFEGADAAYAQYIRDAVQEWALEKRFIGTKEASRMLRKKLLGYQP